MKLPRSLSRPDIATEVAKLWSIVALAILVVSFPAYAQNSKRSTSPVATNDWLQFRGPNGTGVADGACAIWRYEESRLESIGTVRAAIAGDHG